MDCFRTDADRRNRLWFWSGLLPRLEQFTAGAEAAAAEANIAVQVDVAEVFAEAEESVVQTSVVAISIPAPEITPEDTGIILVSPEDQEQQEEQE